MLFAAVFFVATGVGSCWWPISAKAVLSKVALWKFSNKPPNYASVADSITFLMNLHSTCTGPLSGGISCISVLYFVPRKNIIWLCFVPLFLIFRIHLSKCGESFRFFCIILLRLDMLRWDL